MLTRIQLENFKGWRNLDMQLGPITVLVGRNSAGKTNLLQSLLLLKQTVDKFENKVSLNLFGARQGYVDFGSYRELIHEHDDTLPLVIGLGWHYDNEEHSPLPSSDPIDLHYRITWKQMQNQVVLDHLDYRIAAPDMEPPPGLSVRRRDENIYDYEVPPGWVLDSAANGADETRMSAPPESCYKIPGRAIMIQQGENSDAALAAALSIDLDLYNIHFEFLCRRLVYMRPRRAYPRRAYELDKNIPTNVGPEGENTILMLIHAMRMGVPLLDEVTEWLRRMALVDDLRIDPLDLTERFYEVKVVTNQSVCSLLNAGIGVNQVLPVITMLLTVPPGSIVLLEQPEVHLHPTAQAHLADLLLYVAETRRLQLIVESHSEPLVTRLQLRIAQMECDFGRPENIYIYHCQPGDNGSTVEAIRIDEYGQIRDWPANLFNNIPEDLDAMTLASLERHRQQMQRRSEST